MIISNIILAELLGGRIIKKTKPLKDKIIKRQNDQRHIYKNFYFVVNHFSLNNFAP
jgi:hypothetical protein